MYHGFPTLPTSIEMYCGFPSPPTSIELYCGFPTPPRSIEVYLWVPYTAQINRNVPWLPYTAHINRNVPWLPYTSQINISLFDRRSFHMAILMYKGVSGIIVSLKINSIFNPSDILHGTSYIYCILLNKHACLNKYTPTFEFL